MFGERGIADIATPSHRHLQTAAQVPQRQDTLLPCQLKQLQEDGCRYFGITHSAVAVGGGNLEVIGHHVQLEAAQSWQKTASKRNGVESVDGESLPQQLCLRAEETNIKADIVPDNDSTFNKAQEVREDLGGTGSLGDHFLRDARELDNEWRQTPVGVDKALKGVHDLPAAQPDARHLDYAVWPRSQPRRLGVQHDKFNFSEGQLRAAPG